MATTPYAQAFVFDHTAHAHSPAQPPPTVQPPAPPAPPTSSRFAPAVSQDCAGLAALRTRHGALLCLDEAHATLVCGEHGGGAAEAAGVSAQVDVHVGTLSKAFGAHGGFVACDASLKHLLLSRGRPGVYSTALPLPAVAAAAAALRVATPALRQRLRANIDTFADATGVPRGGSHIVPIIVGDATDALAASSALLSRGFHVPAIRPPTVPAATSRLRVALTAAHTRNAVIALARALARTGVLSKLPR